MTEPTLSSDTRSMLHDEHSKRLDALEERVTDFHSHLGREWNALGKLEERVTEWSGELTDLRARVQVIEGDKPHGPWHDLMVRVKALEDYLDHDVIDEVAPLPREDLD